MNAVLLEIDSQISFSCSLELMVWLFVLNMNSFNVPLGMLSRKANVFETAEVCGTKQFVHSLEGDLDFRQYSCLHPTSLHGCALTPLVSGIRKKAPTPIVKQKHP